jgi:hypothetical protein
MLVSLDVCPVTLAFSRNTSSPSEAGKLTFFSDHFIVFLRNIRRLSRREILLDTQRHMPPIHDDLESQGIPPAQFNDDAALERDYQELAQWLIDVYLWKLEQERKLRRSTPVDSSPPSPTM